ncbi:MAG: T9SS type A sorting domain-containing protein [Bacteroidia bacterium]
MSYTFSKSLRYCLKTFTISLLFSFIQLSPTSFLSAQNVSPKWVYILDGWQDADVTDIEVDKEGNTYVSANYGGTITLDGIKEKFPRSPHVHGLILKLDKKGKPLWAHPIVSANDNRINDISIAPNGDLLFTGFADGKAKYGGKKDTIRYGRDKDRRDYHQPQMVYAARYTSDGEPIWVKNFNTVWAEGLSIASNSKGEVYFNLYYKNYLKDGSTMLDTFPKNQKVESKAVTIKLNKKGEFESLLPLSFFKSSSYIHIHHLKIDKEDNLYQYGTFTGSIKFSETDSLSNASYEEGLDSYLVKYSPDGNVEWVNKIGGQNVQFLNEIQIGSDGSIYGTGYYSYECSISNGISLVQKSKFEYKSGQSFFYFGMSSDGELNFIRYEEQGKYSTSLAGHSIALDDFDNAHIVGHFNDTIVIDGKELDQAYRTERYFYSRWKNDKLEDLSTHNVSSNSFIISRGISIGGGQFASCGLYVGDEAKMEIEGKKYKLTVNEHGRSSFIYGGTVPERRETEPLLALKSRRSLYLSNLKPLLACLSPKEEVASNVWFPTTDSIPSRERWLSETPCGRDVKTMEALLYPNPSRGATTLKLVGMMGGSSQVDVFSEKGQLMFSQKIQLPANEYEMGLDLSNVATGIYFVRIVHGGFEKALRFVKVD